jgi:hypothetical protein
MDRQAAYRLEQLVPLFNATDSPDQLSNLVAEAGQILYGTLHDGTLVIDRDDIRTVAVSICDSKREYQRTLWDDGALDFSYRLLFQLVSDSISERQRTIYRLKWSDGAGSNIQQTDWGNDYKHQGQRYALCCTQLASMLTVELEAPAEGAEPIPLTPDQLEVEVTAVVTKFGKDKYLKADAVKDLIKATGKQTSKGMVQNTKAFDYYCERWGKKRKPAATLSNTDGTLEYLLNDKREIETTKGKRMKPASRSRDD